MTDICRVNPCSAVVVGDLSGVNLGTDKEHVRTFLAPLLRPSRAIPIRIDDPFRSEAHG